MRVALNSYATVYSGLGPRQEPRFERHAMSTGSLAAGAAVNAPRLGGLPVLPAVAAAAVGPRSATLLARMIAQMGGDGTLGGIGNFYSVKV